MARNPAVRKAAKAAKRKAVVAAKRRQEIGGISFAGRMREAARLPVLRCLLSDNVFETGAGMIILVRGVSREEQHIAGFMIDTFCLGVKDTMFSTNSRQDAESVLEAAQLTGMSEIAPAEARKLLRDLVAWASGNGFPPAEHYAVLETVFGAIAPAETDYTARFGKDGKVLYMPGPSESPAQVRRRLQMVLSRFGEEALGLVDAISPDDLAEEDDLDDAVYLEGEAEPDEAEPRAIETA